MNINNLVYNFAVNALDQQPLAVMPASLAKKLLFEFAEKLERVSLNTIKGALIDDIRDASDVAGIISAATNFVNERILVDNINAGNWDAYAVSTISVVSEPVLAQP